MESGGIKLATDTAHVGTVQIADDVIAMIASLAATEIEGVTSLSGNITNEKMSKVAMKKLTRGVRVLTKDNVVTIDLAIIMQYGYNIPETCKKVQERVQSSIETMTGLTVSDVNIRIASVNMPKGM